MGMRSAVADRGRRQHLVTVRDEQQQVGAHLAQAIGQAEGRNPDGLGHADIAIGTRGRHSIRAIDLQAAFPQSISMLAAVQPNSGERWGPSAMMLQIQVRV